MADLHIDRRDGLAVVKINQNTLLADYAPMVKEQLMNLSNEGFKNIIIDLSGVQYVDSSGIGTLVAGNRLCKDAAGKLVLMGVSSHIQKLIDVSRLSSILNIIPTLDESIAYISAK